VKINFHRVLLGFFENWDKSSQKKWDKGGKTPGLPQCPKKGIIFVEKTIRRCLCVAAIRKKREKGQKEEKGHTNP
jgi:hypothetical protein